MGHLPDFIKDLALILMSAGVVTIIFKWLKQPVVLGYIVAGLIAGPHFVEFVENIVGKHFSSMAPYLGKLPSVNDLTNITIWADIGVIFLLFALGLDFSIKKLLHVGRTASIATLINMGSMIIIGYVIGQLLGWSSMDCIFLGGMLSMSSTTIIIKAFNDMNLQKKKFASIVFGMLIVEDLAAIIMMVMLTTVAVSKHFEGIELIESLLKLVLFMFIWFVVGIFLIPSIFKWVKKYMNDEILLIISVGLCLGMVLFASAVGFSAALGAFIMGSILSETIESKHIEHLIESLKNFFGAIFFVSVGMMIDPATIWEYGLIILLFTGVVLVGRIIFATLGVVASGQSLKVSIQSGFSLAQIGEFSFIIATLGMSLGVISNILYPIIVAVSVITTFTTPYFIKMSPAVSDFIKKFIPEKWNGVVIGYANINNNNEKKQTGRRKLLKNVLLQVTIYSTLSIAVMKLCDMFTTPLLENIPGIRGSLIAAIITLALMSPFLSLIIVKKDESHELENLWSGNHPNRKTLIFLEIFSILLVASLISYVLIPLFPKASVLIVIISLAITTGIYFFKKFKAFFIGIENHFLHNFHQKQAHEDKKAAIPTHVVNNIKAKDIHIENFKVSPDFADIGRTLKEIDFKKEAGIYIISIIRGSKRINIPGADERVYPYDKIVAVGSDEEFLRLNKFMKDKEVSTKGEQDKKRPGKDGSYKEKVPYHVNIFQYVIEKGNPLIGISIHESEVRKKTETLIINIERKSKSIMDFSSDFIFLEGDILWIAGEEEKLNEFEENLSLSI